MATAAQSISGIPSPLTWFWQFLKEELAPYAGRSTIVARMVLAATLVMIICMTFQLSYAYQGAIYALIISRENSRATQRSGGEILLMTAIGAAYLLLSAWFVVSVPNLHFLWIVGSFFLAFYALSTLNDYSVSSTFAIMIALGVPLWDRHVSAETNVEDTLRLCLAASIGIVVTVVVELAFLRIKPGDEIVTGVAERLASVEDSLARRAEDCPPSPDTETEVARLAVVGTSMLRRTLQRSNYSPHFAEQMGAVIALTGRLVDLAANLAIISVQLSEDDRQRIRRSARNIATLRSDLLADRTPHLTEPPDQLDGVRPIPLLSEIDACIRSIPEALVDSRSVSIYAPAPSSTDPPRTFFVRDALTNVEHLKFGLKGCLAASLCYVIYNATDWPGISTAVTTCLLTALTTIGSSRQKQLLRFSGAMVGGFVLGMGAQIFILPSVDSIAGFTVLFVLITILASWFMTSSPRLSYFGVQLALAYYLIHLQEFAIQPSLSIARDRVVGVLLGLTMMWFVFDQLWGTSAIVQMKKTFSSAVRLLAEFAREPVSQDLRVAIERSYFLRDAISRSFDSVRAAADGVLFEFGPSRQQDLAWRDAIRGWQPQLRTLYLTRIALWKYGAQLPGFELPEAVRAGQRELDDNSAIMLDDIADRLEGRSPLQADHLDESFESLEQAIRIHNLKQPPRAAEQQIESFLTLAGRLKDLSDSLNRYICLPETKSSRPLVTPTSTP